MNLDTFTPPVREDGDRVPVKDFVGRPLIVQVREHRTGVKTKFNSDPTEKSYKADGGEAVLVDVADVSTNSVYLDVLWFSGAIVDSLKPFVASALPVKLFYDTPKMGTNPYVNVEPLTGPELALAQAWAAGNPNRFDAERATRATATQPAAAPLAAAQHAAAQQLAAQPPAAPAFTPLPAAPAAPPAPINPADPAIQALLAQLAAAQQRG